MKKVLFVSPYFAPAWGYGGPPLINYYYAKYLVKHGFEVHFYTTDALDQKRNQLLSEEIDNIKVRRFRNVSNWLAWNFKLFIPYGFAKALQKKEVGKFDFVFISDLRDWQNIFTYRYCMKHKIPYCVAAYGQIQINNDLKGVIKRGFDIFLGKKLIHDARYLLAQTTHELNDYLTIGGDKQKCVLLPLAVNFDNKIKQFNDQESFRKRLNISKNDKVILFIGRINQLKGIDLIIRSMPELLKIFDDLKFVIIGRDDGLYLEKIKRLVSELKLNDKVIIHGPIYGEESYSAYQAADVFVFTPRYYEETSLACLTSLALGTPIVTTHQAEVPYLEKYEAGYAINFDEHELKEKLILCLKDDKLLKEMSLNGKRLIKEVFDINIIGNILKDLIDEASKSK